MYDFTLNKNEEIELISDDTVVYLENEIKNVTGIITNQRFLLLIARLLLMIFDCCQNFLGQYKDTTIL